MIYVLTAINAVILGVVAYLFYAFRQAVDASGVRQIDDYLHELEGSVAQLTEQFERTSTKISKDLLRKTTELQALIGECDTKLVQAAKLRALNDESLSRVRERPGEGVAAAEAAAPAGAESPHLTSPIAVGEGSAFPSVPAGLAARRMSASELLATRAGDGPRPVSRPEPGHNGAAARAVPVAPQPAPPPAAPEPRPAVPAGQPNDKYRLIFLLASEGMDAASIAKHTNLTRGEVEMLLDLRRQGKI